MHTFNSQIRRGSKLPDFTQDEVKNEPMFFNCDPNFAFKNGGEITKSFLTKFLVDIAMEAGHKDPFLPKEMFQDSHTLSDRLQYNFIFDSRVHMLMPNWYPCIPGYHFDDVPRTLPNGQPDHKNPIYRSRHCLALVNGDICPTQFALCEAEFSEVGDNEIAYKKWHPEVINHIKSCKLITILAPTNTLIYFDWNTWHQGTRCIRSGWRWFGRLSWNTNRKPTNEIRKQVQVYLEFPMEGW